ncbi:tryptophan synthase subunit alpha [Candidatus Aquiluna sp. UB-MaderosW2red]|uniref:tryptophan synthase subunit alpha n=1 Tax=Candidatus Aquiluna sp. UB-MaderosW2red TaxID=1855377 RepID=UPI000875C87A|nr:tryptophan synthase subunit alpha [Candidatus Aquiluna sp. UB-MaderosW2red]SCX11820.1 tryptophan synthase, alpha chain [Candidatus Aquiluna sp. UB-MaderosW2red]
MSKISQLLEANTASSRGSLIGYFPAGFPTVDESVAALIAMAKNGCDVLEIGVPYSDPVMDGIVIQKATEKALENGFRLKQLFDVIRRVREEVETPILVMSYWNPIMRFGVEDFAGQLKQAGAQGIITPDLIPDEASSWIEVSEKLELDRVFLVAPSSSDLRIESTSAASSGFVYSVSTMGITGERANLDDIAKSLTSRVKQLGSVPTCVGVGISTAAQVREVNSYANGAIVGTAFVNAFATGGLLALAQKTKELASGLG